MSNASRTGRWEGTIKLPDVPVHISLLPNGKLLFWGRDKDVLGNDVGGHSNTYLWDMNGSPTFTTIPNNRTNLFCSGHAFLPHGRLLVAGGHFDPSGLGIGVRDTNVFNYLTNTWTAGTSMQNGRWYPSNVTIASGEMLIDAGAYRDAQGQVRRNAAPDVYNPGTGTIRVLEANLIAPLLYPYLHQAPNGKVFLAGPRHSFYIDTAGPGDWTFVDNPNFLHDVGTSAIYDSGGKVILVGGRDSLGRALSNVEVIDLALPNPQWRNVQSMDFKRMHHTATILPDGKVLVTGGTSCDGTNNLDCGTPPGSFGGDVRIPELWDPASEQWNTTTLAAHQEVRVYHSTALLLPDARVMVAGGGLPAAIGEPTGGVDPDLFGHRTAEIYSPPYLFDENGEAPRPVVVGAPQTLTYGATFELTVYNSSMLTAYDWVGGVTFVRLPSVTHGLNMNQRINFLEFTNTFTGAVVTAPQNPAECPPGHYMLFVLNANGVPSVASIIRIT
jgi:hypothetical protein